MLSRLPISLAPLKAQNNSKKKTLKKNQKNIVFFVQIKKTSVKTSINTNIYKSLIDII